MQIPTLLLGDFNGSVAPARDYRSHSGARRPVCPLLAQLLGPGSPWADVHESLLPPPFPWTYRQPSTSAASRIDLVLANAAALSLVRGASVLEDVRDGGHSPVLVTLSRNAAPVDWRPPRPKPPPLLFEPSACLAVSAEWASLLEQWLASPVVQSLKSPAPAEQTLDSLATALQDALQRLVALAGGWATRPRKRRLAYDSNAIRRHRKLLADLFRLETECSRAAAQPASWPHHWLQRIDNLRARGIALPRDGTISDLASVVSSAAAEQRHAVQRLVQQHRIERCRRFSAALPRLWKEDLSVVQRWLRAETLPWGSRPVLNEAGEQCLTPAEVDASVRAFWVDKILRQHADVNEDCRWDAFLASPFGAYLPTATWPSAPWTADRVRAALRAMREAASPGMTGIPIAVWRSLPPPWPEAVARLLTLVEAEGRWPAAWLEAYVAMIPKASGGSRPQDQRPITVLEVLYRLWAKGTVLLWASTLQDGVLSDAAFGFRANRGTLHAAQVVSDVLHLQRRRREGAWLASFDLAKCFDSLPWWAVFRTLRAVGVEEAVVRCFIAFYRNVQRRFRYGSILGEPWHASNGLAQGCPASPDLLNVLFEPFHRWAAAQRLGVDVGPLHIASVSFADDLVLVAPSKASLEALIAAYLQWCSLLGVQVTKVQAWSSLGPGQVVSTGASTVTTSAAFRFVGVEIGLPDRAVTAAHWRPRLDKAMATAHRLQSLPLPASLSAVLWRCTVLPQALYGCEIRHLPLTELKGLVSAGKRAVCTKRPLDLNAWTAPEVALSWPLGESAPLHPIEQVRLLQLRWLHLLANSTGIEGIVHRAVAGTGGGWTEPSLPLRLALAAVGWKVVRNTNCLRASTWPQLGPEPHLQADVLLSPNDGSPEPQAVYTDGSLSATCGGAAVWVPDTGESLLRSVPAARSSTHCELVALALAMELSPPHVLTDSLCALHLLRGWGTMSVGRQLHCMDRVEVRQVLAAVAACIGRPTLEKVRAHDDVGVRLGQTKALGNDAVDALAKRAAQEPGHGVWPSSSDELLLGPLGDAVLLVDSGGSVVMDVSRSFPAAWWRRTRAGWASKGPRPRLEALFPTNVELDWVASVGVFRRPLVTTLAFKHRVPEAVVKWTARIRCGCLATRDRLARHGIDHITSPTCLCCGAAVEDDLHVMVGCPATGSADWLALLQEAWSTASSESKVPVPPPPEEWLEAHRMPLLAALIPASTTWHSWLTDADAARFKARLHHTLAVHSV